MIRELQRVCELQPQYSSANTPEMAERGALLRGEVKDWISSLAPKLSEALGPYGEDFSVKASDGVGRKTELPWVRFCSLRMSPAPTQGFYCVIHFATDGSAVFVTIGCGSSTFKNGSFVVLPDNELDQRTEWAKRVVTQTGEFSDSNLFSDLPDYKATRPLAVSFQRATALAHRIAVEEIQNTDFEYLLVEAARRLRLIYAAQEQGQIDRPADLDETLIASTIRPRNSTKGQGYGLSAQDRKLVEQKAMEVVKRWLVSEGYAVTDTSASNPFDFLAEKGLERMKVEVKGTTSRFPEAVLMTRNEVALHQEEKGQTALCIVHSINLNNNSSQRFAEGGTLSAYVAWDIDSWVLEPVAFRVSKPT